LTISKNSTGERPCAARTETWCPRQDKDLKALVDYMVSYWEAAPGQPFKNSRMKGGELEKDTPGIARFVCLGGCRVC
jgi:hypothetical protein